MRSESESSSGSGDLSSRIRQLLSQDRVVGERQMFGGTCFMINGNMCVATWKKSLIVRVSKDAYESLLTEPHTKPADMNGRPMQGWVLVAPDGIASDDDLGTWLIRALEYVLTLPPK
ncbi:MAG: TfoX/Sxy family protein [Gammaproteobacteria bacterium]|nr:TfoX/Sxy family protein [Gammaproteobacteria bacterium]